MDAQHLPRYVKNYASDIEPSKSMSSLSFVELLQWEPVRHDEAVCRRQGFYLDCIITFELWVLEEENKGAFFQAHASASVFLNPD